MEPLQNIDPFTSEKSAAAPPPAPPPPLNPYQGDESADYGMLCQLGFRKTAAICYETLFEMGPTPVTALAERLGQLPQSLIDRSGGWSNKAS